MLFEGQLGKNRVPGRDIKIRPLEPLSPEHFRPVRQGTLLHAGSPPPIAAERSGNLIQPRSKAVTILEPRQELISSEKRFLSHLLCLGSITKKQPAAKPENSRLVGLNKLTEGVRVALEDARDDLAIRFFKLVEQLAGKSQLNRFYGGFYRPTKTFHSIRCAAGGAFAGIFYSA